MTEATASPLQDNIQRNLTPADILVEYSPDPRGYWVDGREVPSVTQVLDILHKPALTWWGMKVGVEGVVTLAGPDGEGQMGCVGGEAFQDAYAAGDIERLTYLLTKHKLTVNHVRDKAASRGSSVHDAFEEWARTGHKPDARNFPPQESGYIAGLLKFIEEVNPEPVELPDGESPAELMVGSARHGYAGRFDLLANMVEKEVQTGPRTKRNIPGGCALLDLKTSKDVYPSHRLQLAAYAEAALECGYGRVAYEAVVLVRENETYDFVVSDARFSQFLDVKRAYDALRGLK